MPISRKNILYKGQTFGLLTVIETDCRLPPSPDRAGRKRTPERAVMVRCQCHKEFLVKVTNLTSERIGTKACRSCSHQPISRNAESYLYQTHRGILGRCYNPIHPRYKSYGARGISLHPDFHDADVFAQYVMEHLGERPKGHSLDRIDNDGDYAPGNLRWASGTQQIHNRRPSTQWDTKRVRMALAQAEC